MMSNALLFVIVLGAVLLALVVDAAALVEMMRNRR